MTTLISIYTSDGCVGRCDANCYEGTGDSCDCCCGGANHGVGLERATENTKEIARYIVAALPGDHELRLE